MLPSLNSIDSTQISSSSSSSPSSFPYSHFANTKTMEEVWKDINITSLPNTPLNNNNINNNNINNNNIIHYININNNNNDDDNNHIIHHPRPTTNFRGMILQDFLNCNNSSISTVDSNINLDVDPTKRPNNNNNNLINEFPQIFETTNNNNDNGDEIIMQGNSGFGCFDGLVGGSVFGVVAKKRFSEDNLSSENLNDRRNKRMIKNRESAARSRARKQAYTTELELELAHLAAENARLRKQQQQLLEAPSTQAPKKKGLQRTLTAPF